MPLKCWIGTPDAPLLVIENFPCPVPVTPAAIPFVPIPPVTLELPMTLFAILIMFVPLAGVPIVTCGPRAPFPPWICMPAPEKKLFMVLPETVAFVTEAAVEPEPFASTAMPDPSELASTPVPAKTLFVIVRSLIVPDSLRILTPLSKALVRLLPVMETGPSRFLTPEETLLNPMFDVPAAPTNGRLRARHIPCSGRWCRDEECSGSHRTRRLRSRG